MIGGSILFLIFSNIQIDSFHEFVGLHELDGAQSQQRTVIGGGNLFIISSKNGKFTTVFLQFFSQFNLYSQFNQFNLRQSISSIFFTNHQLPSILVVYSEFETRELFLRRTKSVFKPFILTITHTRALKDVRCRKLFLGCNIVGWEIKHQQRNSQRSQS